jgi:ferritin-like metal-binding protein YciE
MPIKNLEEAFIDELRDILSAERQITRALKKMAAKASREDLKEAFEEHLEQTDAQITRLEEAFESLGKRPRAQRCEAMAGILEEGEDILQSDAEPEAKDAMMIAAAQKVEHYEIATYGTLCTWAEMLGHDRAQQLLHETLEEEKATDDKLTKLASEINQLAMASE